MWQLSPFALLVRGNFDGLMTAGEVGRHGNMGVGAAEALDGELTVMDGIVYPYMPGGRVVRPAPTLRLPFVIMTQWERDGPVPLRPGQQYTSPSTRAA